MGPWSLSHPLRAATQAPSRHPTALESPAGRRPRSSRSRHIYLLARPDTERGCWGGAGSLGRSLPASLASQTEARPGQACSQRCQGPGSLDYGREDASNSGPRRVPCAHSRGSQPDAVEWRVVALSVSVSSLDAEGEASPRRGKSQAWTLAPVTRQQSLGSHRETQEDCQSCLGRWGYLGGPGLVPSAQRPLQEGDMPACPPDFS